MELARGAKVNIFKMFKMTEVIRREINVEIPPQQMLVFYLIALNKGIGQAEIAKMVNMPEGTVSRNVAKLASRKRMNAKGKVEMFGYGLIETRQDDYSDTRKRCCYLTDKGIAVLNKLNSVLKD